MIDPQHLTEHWITVTGHDGSVTRIAEQGWCTKCAARREIAEGLCRPCHMGKEQSVVRASAARYAHIEPLALGHSEDGVRLEAGGEGDVFISVSDFSGPWEYPNQSASYTMDREERDRLIAWLQSIKDVED